MGEITDNGTEKLADSPGLPVIPRLGMLTKWEISISLKTLL